MTGQVELLAAAAAADELLMERLARVVNGAYGVGEAGLWVDGATRTTAADVAEMVRREWMLAATAEGEVVGCGCVRGLDASTADLGLVSAVPERWGSGVGRELVRSAEELMRARGVATMRLELLVPRDGVHPEKERLRAWYLRLGYRIVRTAAFEEVTAIPPSQLATACQFLVFEKSLAPTPAGARSES